MSENMVHIIFSRSIQVTAIVCLTDIISKNIRNENKVYK